MSIYLYVCPCVDLFFLLVIQYISADVIRELHIEVQHRNSESKLKIKGEQNEDQDIKFKINGNQG